MSEATIKNPTLTAIRKELAKKAVEAVRSHPKLGRGTCSMTDETMTDLELESEFQQLLMKDVARSVNGLVKYQLESEKLWEGHCAEIKATAF